MPKPVKRRKNKLAGRYRNRWLGEAEISGRMIPKWVADSCRNRWPDHPEICIFYKGEESEPNNAVKNALGPLVKNMSITILGDDYAIAEKETVNLLTVTFPCNTELDIDTVAKKLDEIDLLIEYSSAYEKMPNLDTRRL